MFRFTHTSTARAVLAAAAIALFASHAAQAAQPKEISYWADAQSASRAGDHRVTTQFARGRRDQTDKGVSADYASRAGEQSDKGVSAQYASRASDNHRDIA